MSTSGTQPPPHPVHEVLAAQLTARPDGVILDLGCGPGAGLAALRRRWPAARLVGLDLSTASLAAAHGHARPDGAVVVRADLSRPLPLADRGVDALVCHNVTELLPEPAALIGEACRVLRPGGTAVWSHTDFAGLVIHGADDELTRRVCRAYAEIPQRWMAHIDPRAGRRLPGLARRAGLAVAAFDAHIEVSDRLDGQARRRVDEIADVAARHAAQGRVELTTAQVQAWRAQLEDADAAGQFCFAETAFITVAVKPPG